jgi:hypothetical protein
MVMTISRTAPCTVVRVVATLTLLASAARGAEAQAIRETDETGRAIVRQCGPTAWPKKLPALDAVLDSTALWTALRDVPAGDSAALLLGILYREGAAPSVRILESSSPSPVAAGLLDVASRTVRATSAPPPAAAVRVRLRALPAPTASVERSVYCPAQVAPGAPSGPQRTRVVLGPGDRMPAGRTIRVEAQWTINESGLVTSVQLLRSSGIRELDDEMIADLRQRVYRPALLDGAPIATWERSGGRKMRL